MNPPFLHWGDERTSADARRRTRPGDSIGEIRLLTLAPARPAGFVTRAGIFHRASGLAELLAALVFSGCVSHHDAHPGTFTGYEVRQSGIVRGPTESRRLALVFTGHEYAEGAETILDELARHHAHGSFFLTGAFLTNQQFAPLVRRMRTEGHYLGPHSDAHLLYCDWNATRKTLVTQAQFAADLGANAAKLPAPFSGSSATPRFFLPAFEQYNSEIAAWSAAAGFVLVNFTRGHAPTPIIPARPTAISFRRRPSSTAS